ncbi:MAG: enolase C-terminal domain-like protein [Gemmatimonadota bacterium]
MLTDTPRIEHVDVAAYRIPTQSPESDGTLEWQATTMVVVKVRAADTTGLGYTYADATCARFVAEHLSSLLIGQNGMAVPAAWHMMRRLVRNVGTAGVSALAISAVDVALWDLKARLLQVPIALLLGQVREQVPIYGSGGFTSYSIAELQKQLEGWASLGMRRVKMKVGREPARDLERVRAARAAIGAEVELFVDANGAYTRKQALRFAEQFASEQVSWFEEPVAACDLEGLRLLRDRAPAGMDIAAGEYGYEPAYFRRMLEAGAVDVLQADATRCGGITGFLAAGVLCDAHGLPLSAHTAPALHVAVCCALGPVVHVEYFHDHVRIEQLLFDGAPVPRDGMLAPDLTRPGLGLELKLADAEQYAI